MPSCVRSTSFTSLLRRSDAHVSHRNYTVVVLQEEARTMFAAIAIHETQTLMDGYEGNSSRLHINYFFPPSLEEEAGLGGERERDGKEMR